MVNPAPTPHNGQHLSNGWMPLCQKWTLPLQTKEYNTSTVKFDLVKVPDCTAIEQMIPILMVKVPVGDGEDIGYATIEELSYFNEDNVPYPIEKTRKIISLHHKRGE